MGTQQQHIQVDVERNLVTVSVNPDVYSLDVVYGAGFVYVDRAFVMLDRGDEDHVLVTLTARAESDEAALTELGGAFANELLTQAFRESLAKKTLKIRELVINRALYSTLDSGSAGDLDFEDDDDLEFLDDPLGIAVPWEEKYEGDGTAADADEAGEGADEAAEAEAAEPEAAEAEAAEAEAAADEAAEPEDAGEAPAEAGKKDE